MTELLLAVLLSQPMTRVDDVPPETRVEQATDHPWLGFAFGSGVHSPMAFAGLEVLVRPSRYLALGVAVGFGPSVTNPDHRVCLWSCPSSDIRHAGVTPWRWSASVLGLLPLGERVDVQIRLALMRNPGAVYGYIDWEADEDDEYVTDDSRLEFRPMALALLGTLGVKLRVVGPAFARVELGWTQTVYESVPWDASAPAPEYEGLPEVVTSQYSPFGPSLAVSFGFEFL